LGDNENAIEIQIWVAMLANLLITLAKSKLKRSWAFSNLVSGNTPTINELYPYIWLFGRL